MRSFTRVTRAAFALILALPMAGMLCEEPGDSFNISFPPSTTVPRGKSAQVTLTISHTGELPSTTLAAEQLPAGVTASFSPATISDETDAVTMTLTATNDAALGNAKVTIHASNEAGLDYRTDMAFVVEVRGDFQIQFAPTTLTMNQGETKTVQVQILKLQEFDQPIALTVGPATTGMTTTLDPTTIASGSTTSTLTIAANDAALTGSKTFNITGTTEGLAERVGVLQVTVNQRPAITLSAAGSHSVIKGGSSSFPVNINRMNFTGSVAFSVSGLPANVTYSAGSTVGDQGTITFTAASNAASGTYSLTITATGSGISSATTNLTLTIP